MKIGIHVLDVAPGSGGAHTILSSTTQLVIERLGSHHELVLIDDAMLGIRDMSPPRKELGWIARWFNALRPRRQGRLKPAPGRRERAQTALIEQGIEFLLYLHPDKAQVFDIPFGIVLWDLEHLRHPFFPEVSMWYEWERRERYYHQILKRAALIFVPNETGRREAIDYYHVHPERLVLVPHPTPDWALTAGPAIFDGNRAFDYLLYPAQFWPHKDHVVILHALALLRQEYGWPLRTVFVGSDKGNQSHVQERARALGVDDLVEFRGFIPKEELIALYRNAFALCYASFFGPENLPPLEAMALACPVVTAEYDGAHEQLGEAALFFPRADERALAERLLELKGNAALRKQLVERGLERSRRFTSDDFARVIEEAIDQFSRIRRAWGAGYIHIS